MDQVYNQSEKLKKFTFFKSLLDAKQIDKNKIKENFLGNFSNIPQELRLLSWKIFLGISNLLQDQFVSSDIILSNHYSYLKRIIENVLNIKVARNQEELNYCIYLLDRDYLPLNQSEITLFKLMNCEAFCLIYKQLTDILDDQQDFESYYLTVELYELLRNNLKTMSNQDIINKSLILNIDIDVYLLSGLACLFNDVKMYHIIWDRLVMGEYDLLIFTLISLFEMCKEDHLKQIKTITYKNIFSIKKMGLDEVKILKRALKYYKNIQHNPQVSTMIINYFNTK